MGRLNLVPEAAGQTGNYWCSWDTQFRLNSVEDGKDTKNLRNILTQETLFGDEGLVSRYFNLIRQDMLVLLDDGWDVPPDTGGNGPVSVFGSLILDENKFPDFTGTPPQRLLKVRKKMQDLGYKGLGLWICANAVGEREAHPDSLEQARAYWKERAIWCRKAGVDYWKVDWGYHCGDADYRDMMTETVKAFAPDLKVEHAVCMGPLDRIREDEEITKKRLACSDYFRTYDILKEFTYSTTIQRAWDLLKLSFEPGYGCNCVLNVEDAPYLAAGLGCSMGVMRHPVWGHTQTDVLAFGCKYNEVERALHWQRIAPPFGIRRTKSMASEKLLEDWTDSLNGPDAQGWVGKINPVNTGKRLTQSAPAILSRNLEIPELSAADGEELPFTVCSRHPDTGAVSIAFLPRFLGEQKMVTPQAYCHLPLPSFQKEIGIFGEFAILRISLDEAVEGRVYLQDLCRQEAVDVTELVAVNRKELYLDLSKLKEQGFLDNDPGDCSAPGFMLKQVM